MKLQTLLIPVLAVASHSALSQANEAHIRSAMAQSTITIDGKEHPDQIPYSVRMQTFFQRFKTIDLPKTLGLQAPDTATLTVFANELDSLNQKIQEDHDRRWLKIADQAEGMDASEIAAQVMALRASTESRLGKQYRAVLARLSPTGRTAVERYVSDNVRPSVMTNDEAVLARQAPDFYKEQVIATREYVRSGNWPMDVASDGRSTNPVRSNQTATSSGNARVGTNWN